MKAIVLAVLLGSAPVLAQTEDAAKAEGEPAEEPAETPAEASPNSEEENRTDKDKKEGKREDTVQLKDVVNKRTWFYGHLNLFGVGIITPYKTGLTLGTNLWQYASIEGEISQGSTSNSLANIEIQEVSETVLTVTGRVYPWAGTLNVFMGWGRRDLSVDLLDVISTTATQEGWSMGFGHRWTLAVFSIAVDWVTIWNPVGDPRYTDGNPFESESVDDALEDAKDQLEKVVALPTVTLAKIGIGFQF